ARRDALLVREYEQPRGVDVVLDWSALHALSYEARIRRLARWVDDAERDGRRYRLELPGQPSIGPGTGPRHRHACLRALALLPDREGAESSASPASRRPPRRCWTRPAVPGCCSRPPAACCRCCCNSR